MTVKELETFIAAVRADIDEAIVELAAMDVDNLPPEVKAGYDDHLRGWVELRRMTDEEIVALIGAAWKQAGRELTLDELLDLIGLHRPGHRS